MTTQAAYKMERHTNLCSLFGLPVVNFVDPPGNQTGLEAELGGALLGATRVAGALHECRSPWVSIVARRCFGMAGALHGPKSSEELNHRFAWPSARWGSIPIEGGVMAAHKKEIEEASDPAAKRRRRCTTTALTRIGDLSYCADPRMQGCSMAKLVFGMNQSLDGYVDHMAFAPSPTLFRHFIEQVGGLAGSVYGRRMYEVMRYWDDDRAEWSAEEREFAAAWRGQPKWVVSRSLKSVGPNATLVSNDVEGVIRGLKAEFDGEIDVAGPDLARSMTDLGLIDEYRIYLHPVVVGSGKPFFAGPRPPLHLSASERMDEDVIRLAYVPA